MFENLVVPTMAEMLAQGKQPEVLFWVGCSGSFDDRAKRITKAFVKILNNANVDFANGTINTCNCRISGCHIFVPAKIAVTLAAADEPTPSMLKRKSVLALRERTAKIPPVDCT